MILFKEEKEKLKKCQRDKTIPTEGEEQGEELEFLIQTRKSE